MNNHRWNGWPGAICMDCGIADPREECLAEGDCYCSEGGGDINFVQVKPCKIVVPPCLGKKKYDHP